MAKRGKGRSRTIRMVVIPEPEPGTRSVLLLEGAGTIVMSGEGPPTTLVCGNCMAPLARGIRVDQIRNVVLRCNRCKRFNEPLVS